jgi:DNA-binding CsgD family transcriptional regulator
MAASDGMAGWQPTAVRGDRGRGSDVTAMISDSSSRAHGKAKPPARSAGERASGEIRDVFARLGLARTDWPETAVLTPLLDALRADRVWVMAFLLGAIAGDALGDPDAAGHALQCALDLAGPAQALIHPPPERHPEALTHGETRVLHYLPTHLSTREIAGELYISVNTVKTHQRHLYQKLGARNRAQAVEQARARGLLAPSSRSRREHSGQAPAHAGQALRRRFE